MTAAFLALFIAYAIYLIQSVHELITYYVALTLGGSVLILALLISESIPHGRFMQRMNEYIRQVQRQERLPDMINLYNTGRWIRMLLARRTAGEPAASTNRQRRGLGFFLLLAVTLWFTGFFAWSQTVIWQSVLSDISHNSSLSGIETIAAEGIVETLIVSALFGFYLWLAYGLSSAYREVFDGLFGIRKREMETKKEENGKGAV